MARTIPPSTDPTFPSAISKTRTREDLRQDILVSLGAPIIKIELASDHLDKCIDYALKMFWDWHPDGSFENYYSYTLTQTDADNGYISIPEWIEGVADIVPNGTAGGSASTFGTQANALQMQITSSFTSSQGGYSQTTSTQSTGGYVNGLNRFDSGVYNAITLGDYLHAMSNLAMMQDMLGNGRDSKVFRWVRYNRRCYLYFPVAAGSVIALKCYENIDPDTKPECAEAFDNEWLKGIAVSQAKQLWGSILRKYGGISLPGGVTLEGDTLIQEGKDEEAALMEEVQGYNTVGFYMG